MSRSSMRGASALASPQALIPGLLPQAVLMACLAMSAAVPVHAQVSQTMPAAQPLGPVQVQISADSLDQVLNRFAAAAGVMLTIDGALTAGKRSEGLRGSFDVKSGLAAILAGSGLEAVQQAAGGYMLRASAPRNSADNRADNPAVSPAVSPAPARAYAAAETALPTVSVVAFADAGSYSAGVPVSSATRSPVAVMDLPQTVDVVSEASIRDRGASSIKDALAYTPGVTTSTGEGIREQFVIRGFSAIADTYVDGMRDGGNTFRDTFNLEQVEVVKGPAGVLYGRGSAGGLINLVTKRPLATAQTEVAATVGSHDARRLTLDLNRPVTDDVLLRVNAMVDEAESFRSGVWSSRRGLSLASTVKFSDAATLDLRAQHVRDKRVFDAGIPGLNGRPADVPVSTYYGALDPGNNDSGTSEDTALSADLSVDLGADLKLRNTLSYRTLDLVRLQSTIDRLILTTASPTLRLARSNFSSQQQDLSNKLELIAKRPWLGVQHEFLVGTEFAREKRDTLTRGGALAGSYDIGVFNPVLRVLPAQGATVRRDGIYDTDTVSLYLQDLIRFNERWVALAGLRKDWLERDFRNRAGPAYARKDDFLSPRLGVVYQPSSQASSQASPQASHYASVTKSYQPGSATGVIDPGNAIQPPEISTNYEVGSKFSFKEGRLQLGVSLFQLVKANVPTRDPSDSTATLYVGEVTAKGLELTAVGNLGNGLSVQGGLTWLDAVVTRSSNTTAPAITPTPAATALEGKRAANSPKFSATLWGMQRFDARWRGGVGVRHQAKSYASTTNAVELPSYTVLDAGLFHEHGPWSFDLNVRNLTDRRYYESSTNDLGILPAAPRSFQFTARYLF